jgi:hypothetical protein
MKRLFFWRLLMVGTLAISPLLGSSAQAHMRGMYATKAEAEKRAAELKCQGVFDALQKAQ